MRPASPATDRRGLVALALWLVVAAGALVVLATADRVGQAGLGADDGEAARGGETLEERFGGRGLSELRVVLRTSGGTFDDPAPARAASRALARAAAVVPGTGVVDPLALRLDDLVSDDRRRALATLRLPVGRDEAVAAVDRIREAIGRPEGLAPALVGGPAARDRDRGPGRVRVLAIAGVVLLALVVAGAGLAGGPRAGVRAGAVGAAGALAALAAVALAYDGRPPVEAALAAGAVGLAAGMTVMTDRRGALTALAAAAAACVPFAFAGVPGVRAAALGGLAGAASGALAHLTLPVRSTAPARGPLGERPGQYPGLLALGALLVALPVAAIGATHAGGDTQSARAMQAARGFAGAMAAPEAIVVDTGRAGLAVSPEGFQILGEVSEEMRTGYRVAWPTAVGVESLRALAPGALVDGTGRWALIERAERPRLGPSDVIPAVIVEQAMPGSRVLVTGAPAREEEAEDAAVRALAWTTGLAVLLVGLVAGAGARSPRAGLTQVVIAVLAGLAALGVFAIGSGGVPRGDAAVALLPALIATVAIAGAPARREPPAAAER